MKSLLPLMLIPLLAACEGLPNVDENGQFVPPPPPPLPAQVRAAMPPGMPDAFVFETGNGCWAVGIEASEPRSGYPLRNANGTWVCSDGVVPPDAVVAAPAAPAEGT